MAGSNAKESELEAALFNSVHECAQLRKDHQDAIDEMAVTMSRQKADYEHHMAQVQANTEAHAGALRTELEVQTARATELQKRADSFNEMHTKDMAQASEDQHKLQMSLSESRSGLGSLSAEHQANTVALQNLQLESRMKEREHTAALKEAELENRNLKDLLAQQAARLNHQVQLANTKEQYLREQYEHQLAMKAQEASTEAEMFQQQSDLRFEKSEDVASAAAASMQAAADKKHRELAQLLREANEARKQQGAEIDQLKSLLTDQVEHSKKREAVHEYQLEAANKKQDRLELEKTTAEQRAGKVTEESDMMRRTLEIALREADTTAKNLREDLERVNRKYIAELNKAREDSFVLKEQLSNTKAQLDQSEEAREEASNELNDATNAQKRITERVQLELASSRKAEEQQLLQIQDLQERLRQVNFEKQRQGTDLEAERAAHATSKSELSEARANAQAIHREMLESCSQLRAQLVQERSASDVVQHQKDLLAVDLRRAAEDRDSARRELATSMRKSMALSREAEEANKLSEGLKYRMQEVSASQEDVLGGPTFHPRYTGSGASASKLSPRLHAPQPSAQYAV